MKVSNWTKVGVGCTVITMFKNLDFRFMSGFNHLKDIGVYFKTGEPSIEKFLLLMIFGIVGSFLFVGLIQLLVFWDDFTRERRIRRIKEDPSYRPVLV